MCVNTYFILMTVKVELCAILFLFIHPQLIAVSRNIRYIYCLFMVRVWKKIAPNIYIYALGNTVVKIIWSSKWQFCLYFKNFTLYILRRNLCCCVCLVTQSCLTPCTIAHQAPLPMKILQARILEWVAMPSCQGSSKPKNFQVSHIEGKFFTVWATRAAHVIKCLLPYFVSFWEQKLFVNV